MSGDVDCARCGYPILGLDGRDEHDRYVHARVPCPPPARKQFTVTDANDTWPIHTDSFTYAMHALHNRAVTEGRADLIDHGNGQHLILTNNT